MRKKLSVNVAAPQYTAITGVTFAQVDSWFGHTRKDLKMDIIYPEKTPSLSGKDSGYPCILWICGGAWLSLDRSAHLAYLAGLARKGFAVASAEYRTSNEVKYPVPIQDIKAAVRYLRAYAGRYNIDGGKIGVMGESAGGYLAAMVALSDCREFNCGSFTEYPGSVQAACCWYPPTDFSLMEKRPREEVAVSPESLFLGKNAADNVEETLAACPVNFVTGDAPPFLIIHGNKDTTVPFPCGEALYDKLEQAGVDASLVEIEGAGHADIRFFQEEVWDIIAEFFKEKLG